MKPATPLPWNVVGNGYTVWAENEIIFSANSPRMRGTNANKDAAYIVHAANAYPGMVETVRDFILDTRNELGPDISRLEALLRELGEAA